MKKGLRRAAECSAEAEAMGRSRGGFGTQIHAITDAPGNSLDFMLTGGQAETLLGLTPEGAKDFTGDKGYDNDALVQAIDVRGMEAFIPPHSNRTQPRKVDWFVYKERPLIACFFNESNTTAGFSLPMRRPPPTTWVCCDSSLPSSGCVDTSTEPSTEGCKPLDYLQRVARSREQLQAPRHDALEGDLCCLKPGQHTRGRYLVSEEGWRPLVWRMADHDEYDRLPQENRRSNLGARFAQERRSRYEPFVRMDLYSRWDR